MLIPALRRQSDQRPWPRPTTQLVPSDILGLCTLYILETRRRASARRPSCASTAVSSPMRLRLRRLRQVEREGGGVAGGRGVCHGGIGMRGAVCGDEVVWIVLIMLCSSTLFGLAWVS